ncbi:HupE/UreJ family protein [Methylomonas montana]|uniref:HupE/UreJ family protein n=1 Tax=Methylomonas montana TaxID=3058963 RepID=UPI002658699B|nr:HupE/UreJ family protein [Methylomonas montana]WKJ90097.1 HupE/UreJ family protein [Methylomonas montana]
MQLNRLSKQSDSGRRPGRLLLSFGLPFALLLAFLGNQIVDFDSIGWSNGFSHPLTGWDHLVTMLAVGIWAAQLRGQAIWMLPLAFVGVMSLGGLAGAAGLAIPSVEGIILLSCAVFSVLITRKVRFSAQINVLIVAFFAFFHGFAHGQEISTSASLISYTLGFMLATLLLHGAGILVAKLVVFGITCLLTLMFSSAALAKNAESLAHDKIKTAALVEDTGFGDTAPFWIATNQTGFVGTAKISPVEEFARRGVGTGHGSATSGKIASPRADSVENDSTEIKADDRGYVLTLKPAALHELDSGLDRCSFNPDDPSHSGLDFNHYYPDINHTPGRQLLSNGVGLTSPPALYPHVLAPQAAPNLRNTPIPAVEEPNLQPSVAKFDSDKFCFEAHKDCAYHGAFREGHIQSFNATTGSKASRSLVGNRAVDTTLYPAALINRPLIIPPPKQVDQLSTSSVNTNGQDNLGQMNNCRTVFAGKIWNAAYG